jgi:transposase
MQGDVVSQSTDQDHLESGQLGTADVTASTVANIGPGIDFYFGFGVIAVTAGVAAPLTILAAATALLVTVGYTVAIASVFTMSGGLVAMTFSQFTSWHPWWGPFTVVLTAGAIWLTARGVKLSTVAVGTVRRDLLALADWLRCWGVTRAGMEPASDYWKPVFFLLKGEGFDCVLYQASQVRALPGRPKTDKLDSVWLAKVTERGSLAGSFVPPEDIRRLRTHTRYCRKLVQARTAEKERCGKLLEDAHLKLSSVISDIHGVSGRDMLTAVIAGERDPRVLAEMARGRMRRKTARLEEALDCSFFTREHAFVLQMMLANIDHLTAQVAVLDERIAVLCRPYERQIAQLDAIPDFGATLGETAASAGRTQTFLGAKLRRLCRHMPRKKAQAVIMRSQIVIAHALLSDPEASYQDLGPGYYEQRAGARRRAAGHVRSLQRLGYNVTIETIDPEPASSPANPPSPPGAPRREADGANRRRLLPPARLRSYFRTSGL